MKTQLKGSLHQAARLDFAFKCTTAIATATSVSPVQWQRQRNAAKVTACGGKRANRWVSAAPERETRRQARRGVRAPTILMAATDTSRKVVWRRPRVVLAGGGGAPWLQQPCRSHPNQQRSLIPKMIEHHWLVLKIDQNQHEELAFVHFRKTPD